jgi:hypothetical protein
MKIIISQSSDIDTQVDFDSEALHIDDYELARFIENAIYMLQTKLQNIYSSIE